MIVLIMFLFILLIAPILFVLFIYNRLVGLKNDVDRSYAQIDVLLTKRADLIPNLVETVKGYAKHEKEVLENVTRSRSSFLDAKGQDDRLQKSDILAGTLKTLFAVAENYPDLKADKNFQSLQSELSSVENEIAGMRMSYNNSVRNYNTLQETFPANLFASSFGHATRSYFESKPESKEPPEVSF